jgi:stearoyl-CoA desaturase (delta-9 desaturase)
LVISVGVNAALVAALGWLTGNWLGVLVFGLLLRLVLTHHFTFLINSAAHMWGSQPWSTSHSARDSWLLSFFTFGEGYHNYHHTFQSDYRNGALWYNWDPTKWLIWGLSRLGLARRLRRSPVDVTLKKLYDQARATFEERLESASETLEALRVRGRKAGDDARVALAERLLAAEAACDEALAELTRVRQGFQSAVSADARRRSVRKLKRQLRDARKSAEAALDQWRELGEAYVAAHA